MRWTIGVLSTLFFICSWGCASVDTGSSGDTDTDSDTDTDGDTDTDSDSDTDTDTDTDTDSDAGPDTDTDTDTDTGECGNDTIDSPELCDGTDLGGQDCGDFGFLDGGVLECGTDCDELLLDDCLNGCGNNLKEGSEACDGTDLDGQNCTNFGYTGGVLECETDCSDFNTGSCSDGCGNDSVETGEVCDGTDLNGETCATLGFTGGTLSCSAICDGYDVSACTGGCGNGVQETGEDCDAADLNGQSCTSQGYYGGTLACDSSCGFDFGACAGTCGDDTADTGDGEVCDGTDLNGTDCSDYGFYFGTLLCNGACSGFVTTGCSGFCGDNTANTGEGEVCDGTDLNGNTCVSEGYYGGTLTCNAGCSGFFYSSCTGYCGDGVVQTSEGEECDTSNLNGNTCSGAGFYYGTPTCTSCSVDDSSCSGYCGDGILDTTSPSTEVCDGTDFGSTTCSDYGYTSGYLVCDSACSTIDSSNCYGTCTATTATEAFEGSATGWTTVDGGDYTGDTWALGTGYCASGSCAYVDSDYWGGDLTETLISPEYTVGGCSTGTVSFYHYYNDYDSYDSAAFQIIVDGGSPITLQTWTSDASGTVSYSIGSYIAGATTVQFQWYYDDGGSWAWYWYVDDFSLSISS